MTSIINQQTQSNQLIANLNEMCKALFNSVDKNVAIFFGRYLKK